MTVFNGGRGAATRILDALLPAPVMVDSLCPESWYVCLVDATLAVLCRSAVVAPMLPELFTYAEDDDADGLKFLPWTTPLYMDGPRCGAEICTVPFKRPRIVLCQRLFKTAFDRESSYRMC